MPTVGEHSVQEMDAAMALLELQHSSRDNRGAGAIDAQQLTQTDSSNETEDAATAAFSYTELVGCRVLSVSNGTAYPDPSVTKVIAVNNPKYPGNNGFIIKRNVGTKLKNLKPKSTSRIIIRENQEESRPLPVASPLKVKSKHVVNKTCDIGTQTEEDYLYYRIAHMEANIKEYCRKNKLRQEQKNCLKALIASMDRISVKIPVHNTDYCVNSSRRSYNRKAKTNITLASVEDSYDESDYKPESEAKEENMDVSDDSSVDQGYRIRNKVLHKVTNAETSTDLMPIGDGNAMVPSRLLRQISWASYTNATRKLLTAVFSRRVLATHSLTGKPSPAFPNKPAKKKLDAALVNDIIQTVVERCCVPENLVRTSITTKCADESKMLRSRQQNKKKRGALKKENIPPTRPRSDSSAY